MPSDSLDQHRRELDATFAALQSIRDHAHAAAALDRATWAAIAALREDVQALSNRVEALTRALYAPPCGVTGHGTGPCLLPAGHEGPHDPRHSAKVPS